jgi:NTP pyrophosphatase (non-canonical NTP hydrolase)
MEGVNEGLKPGTRIDTTLEEGDVEERLEALREKHLGEADEVVKALESGEFREDDAALEMEEAV